MAYFINFESMKWEKYSFRIWQEYERWVCRGPARQNFGAKSNRNFLLIIGWLSDGKTFTINCNFIPCKCLSDHSLPMKSNSEIHFSKISSWYPLFLRLFWNTVLCSNQMWSMVNLFMAGVALLLYKSFLWAWQMTQIKFQVFKGLYLFVIDLFVKGKFPAKPLPFCTLLCLRI